MNEKFDDSSRMKATNEESEIKSKQIINYLRVIESAALTQQNTKMTDSVYEFFSSIFFLNCAMYIHHMVGRLIVCFIQQNNRKRDFGKHQELRK